MYIQVPPGGIPIVNNQGVPIRTGDPGPLLNNGAPLPPISVQQGQPPNGNGPNQGSNNRQNRPLFNFPSLRLPNLSDIFGL